MPVRKLPDVSLNMNIPVLMAASSGIVLAIFHFLNCGPVDGYLFQVNKVETCPSNKTDWSIRSEFLKCNKSEDYLCLSNENRTELLEFCYIKSRITVPEGICLVLLPVGVDGYNCQNFTNGCPNSTYSSDEAFKYPNCVSIANGCFLVDSICNSDKSTPLTTRKVLGELPSTKKDANTFIKIVFGLYFGIAISLCGIYLCVSYNKVMPNRGTVIYKKCTIHCPKEKTDVHELLKNILLKEETTEEILKVVLCDPLFIVCLNGEVNDVQQYLTNNDGIQTCTIKQILPLYVACFKGHTYIVKILLENYGHDPYQLDHEKEKFTKVQQLLNMTAYCSACDGSLFEILMFSPLHIACQKGNTAVVEYLLQNGADVNLCSADGTSPLYLACQEGHTDTVRHLLLENYVDVNYRNNAGKSPLHVACLKNHIDIVKCLLNNEANINVYDNKGKSPIDIAKDHGWTDLVRLLNVNIIRYVDVSIP